MRAGQLHHLLNTPAVSYRIRQVAENLITSYLSPVSAYVENGVLKFNCEGGTKSVSQIFDIAQNIEFNETSIVNSVNGQSGTITLRSDGNGRTLTVSGNNLIVMSGKPEDFQNISNGDFFDLVWQRVDQTIGEITVSYYKIYMGGQG